MHSNLPVCSKIGHSVLVPFVWLIMYAIVAGYNRYIFFNDSFLPGGLKAIKYIISILFYFCSIMAMICHTLTILTDPGSLDYDIVYQLGAKERTNCGKCQKDRPLRAHHCSVCKKCFMKMDHHCPWVFNCVGFANQKTFFLFITYTNLGSIIALGMFIGFFCSGSFKDMYDLSKHRKLDFGQNNMRIFGDSFKKLGDVLMIIFVTIIVVLTICSVLTLFFSQIYLILRNITNIENDAFQGREHSNPYFADYNRWFIFKTVLGLNEKWKWFFPIVEPNIYNGGYIFDIPFNNNNNSNNNNNNNYNYNNNNNNNNYNYNNNNN